MNRLVKVSGMTAGIAALLWLGIESASLSSQASSFCYSQVGTVPEQRVGLLLGCSSRLGNGRPNPYFERRLQAAADLFLAGKIRFILVSGDNGRREYDEPTIIKRALVKKGIPATGIVLDYAGFRTFDSVLRARDVFGLTEFTVISQHFQNERAIFIARANGIQAIGYDAPDVYGRDGVRTRVRELFARARAVLDVRILGTRPRYLGPPIRIGNPPDTVA